MQLSTIYDSLSFKTRPHHVRYLIIPLLALVLVHLVAYGKLPFDDNYQFPTIAFFVILGVGLAVCETNRINYCRLNRKISSAKSPVRKALQQVSSNLIWSSIVFLILTVIFNLFLWGVIPSVTRLLSYLFIILLISFSETITFIAWDYYNYARSTKIESEPQTWLIKTATSELIINPPEVSCIHSANGIVTLFLSSGKKIITSYNSLKEIEVLFDVRNFFKASRQVLVRAEAIEKVSNDQNRKLKIELIKPLQQYIPQITISRYKNAEFKSWFRSLIV